MTRRTTIAMLAVACLFVAGCGKKLATAPAALTTPPPRYSGPQFMQGTVGSMATLRGYQPVLVSGYGLVVNLNRTGSGDCPPALRQRMLSMISRMGFGVSAYGHENMSPSRVLADDSTAVVRVEGVIPPGAPKGARFDLLVSALPSSQTTSLEGGILYTTDLAVGGAELSEGAVTAIARGRGPLFLNPFVKQATAVIATDGTGATTEDASTVAAEDDPRVGRILGGGYTIAAMPLGLDLLHPSFRAADDITARINGRFPPTTDDKTPIAVAKSDSLIAINIPKRFTANPQRMLDLVSHLYMNPTVVYAEQKARELRGVLEAADGAKFADDVAYCWEAMGKPILPLLREMYGHEQLHVRLAALQAGARLADGRVIDPLFAVATSAGGGSAAETATALLGEMLVHYPEDGRLAQMLRTLLNSDDAFVRLAAFEGLGAVGDSTVLRMGFEDKMELAVVQSDKPMIYVSRQNRPRVIVFDQRTGFHRPMLFSLWDGGFMIDAKAGSDRANVFYRPRGPAAAGNGAGAGSGPMRHDIPGVVASLAVLMAHRNKGVDDPTPGLDMSYSQIVAVLHNLHAGGWVDAPIVLENSDLAERIARRRIMETTDPGRPETRDEGGAARPDRSAEPADRPAKP